MNNYENFDTPLPNWQDAVYVMCGVTKGHWICDRQVHDDELHYFVHSDGPNPGLGTF